MSTDKSHPQFKQENISQVEKHLYLQEIAEVKELREKFSIIAEISDPLTREYQFLLLEKEIEKSGLSTENYRRLFETYLQNKEHIPQYPKTWWLLTEWINWFLRFPRNIKLGLLKTILLTALEKGVLISLAVTLFKYYQEAPKRQQQDHYQAWTIINSAKGQKASAGRIEALEELNKDRVSLNHIVLNGANLRTINLKQAQLSHASFKDTDLGCTSKKCSVFKNANLYDTKFQNAYLYHIDFELAHLAEANLQKAWLEKANFKNAWLDNANIQGAELQGANFQGADIENTNFIGAKNLTPEQVKSAKNWEKACYDPALRIKLGLPSENPDYCENKLK